ncbi:MAG: amidohydrolase family protein [Acidobacteriota bacterium]|nr:amidohydrolase family protein [Acidobacteriota bacterium]
MLDTLITGAEVYDGNGGEPRRMAVGIKDDRIAYVGERPGADAAKETVDAGGLWLSPGFIDSHASTGLSYTRKGAADNKLYQGVSFELIGNCGTSTAPVGDHLVEVMHKQGEKIGFNFDWRSLNNYFTRVEDFGLPINLATLVGHSTLRHGSLEDWEALSDDELEQMKTSLDEAMSEGSFGLSSGLVYPPGCFAETSELIELGKVVAKHGGFYASHIRDERTHLKEAVDEALEIGRGSGIPVLISHLKAADKINWGKIPGMIRHIEAYREEHGVKAIVDVYPYTAVSTKMRTFLPKDITADGIAAISQKLETEAWRQKSIQWMLDRQTGLDEMMVISEDIPGTCGKTVTEIAAMWQMTPQEAACELVRRFPELWMVYHCISDDDMDTAVMWEDAIICSDSWSYPINAATDIGNPHPRTYGAFSRFLDRYVFTGGMLSYGDAVKKITSQPADFMGLKHRGRIEEGYWADILLMDPDRFADNATYQNPRRFSEGVAHLWINGRRAIRDGVITDDTCGKVIRPER